VFCLSYRSNCFNMMPCFFPNPLVSCYGQMYISFPHDFWCRVVPCALVKKNDFVSYMNKVIHFYLTSRSWHKRYQFCTIRWHFHIHFHYHFCTLILWHSSSFVKAVHSCSCTERLNSLCNVHVSVMTSWNVGQHSPP
jgi:hypothetical protein